MTLILAVAASILLSQNASAQSAVTYPAIVDQYIAGDAVGAVKQLASTRARLSGEIVTRAKQFPDPQVRAAVMMHTELAAAWLVAGQPGAASAQLDNARRLLAILTEDTHRRDPSKAFAIRWYGFRASLFAAQGLYDQASASIRDGLSVFPAAAELYLAGGAVHEARAALADTDPRNRFPDDRARVNGDQRRLLQAAAADFERALSVDETLAAAYLHRGWVHFRVGDPRAAAELQAALDRAADDDTRYLAHLFLGAVADDRQDPEGARREFEAAAQLAPYQSAFMALSRLEEALGHRDRARAIADEYAGIAGKLEDPWWDYRLGAFMTGALGWLRQEARRP